jgi:hypothetical protein
MSSMHGIQGVRGDSTDSHAFHGTASACDRDRATPLHLWTPQFLLRFAFVATIPDEATAMNPLMQVTAV